jgi:hypothetical protein
LERSDDEDTDDVSLLDYATGSTILHSGLSGYRDGRLLPAAAHLVDGSGGAAE